MKIIRPHIRYFLGLCCLLLWSVAAVAVAQKKSFTIVIDPGHGGKDAGAVGKLTQEKTINLNVALALGQLIEQNHKDVKVVYTRKTDVFIPLDQRARIANTAKADLFLSIHTNAVAGNSTVRGTETYTLGMHRAKDNLEVAKRENSVILHEQNYKTNYAGFDPSKAESYIIFELMQDQFMKQSVDFARKIQGQYANTAQRKNKGVHQAGFLVLRATSMPSVLTELGFISTPDEEAFLHSADGVKKLAQSLYKAFVQYKNEQQGQTAASTPTPTTSPSKKKEIAAETLLSTPTLAAAINTPDTFTWQPTPIDTTLGTLRPVEPLVLAGITTTATPSALPTITSTEVDTLRSDTNLPPPSTTPLDQPIPIEAVVAPTQPDPPSAKKSSRQTTQQKPTKNTTTTKQATTATPPTSPTTRPTIEYRVQIFATSAPLAPNDKRIEGLPQLAHYVEGQLYKYTVGHAKSEAEAAKLRSTLTARFPQCFIIALRDGKRITIAEARAAAKS